MIAVFIIYNTFQMNVGERRRQIGIIRALGTTRDQIVTMIVCEGLMLGVMGVLFGWVVGYLRPIGYRHRPVFWVDLPITRSGLHWFPFALAGALGLTVAVAGAYFPAQRASRLSPAEAMRVVASGELEPSKSLPGGPWHFPFQR